jgi:hypothetical protein
MMGLLDAESGRREDDWSHAMSRLRGRRAPDFGPVGCWVLVAHYCMIWTELTGRAASMGAGLVLRRESRTG